MDWTAAADAPAVVDASLLQLALNRRCLHPCPQPPRPNPATPVILGGRSPTAGPQRLLQMFLKNDTT